MTEQNTKRIWGAFQIDKNGYDLHLMSQSIIIVNARNPQISSNIQGSGRLKKCKDIISI